MNERAEDRASRDAPKIDTIHDPPENTRRQFVGAVARKAVYVAPVIMAMQTRSASAAGVSCKPFGSPCAVNIECCSNACGTNGKCKM